jgi:hypothetical protein
MIRNWGAGVAAAVVVATAMVVSPATAHAATPPVHAGTEIRVANNICSLGYVLPGADGKAEGLTAGHCGKVGDVVTDRGGNHLGYIADSSGGLAGDIARIRFDGLPQGSLTTWVPFDDRMLPVLGSMTLAEVMESRPVLCKVGRTTGQSCGAVARTYANNALQFVASSDKGDSGAPVYALGDGGVFAVGVLFGSSVDGQGVGTGEYTGITALSDFASRWGLTVASPAR